MYARRQADASKPLLPIEQIVPLHYSSLLVFKVYVFFHLHVASIHLFAVECSNMILEQNSSEFILNVGPLMCCLDLAQKKKRRREVVLHGRRVLKVSYACLRD